MAEGGSYGLGPRLVQQEVKQIMDALDIQQLSTEAQHRWLRPAEICEILRNHQKFRITPEPPSRPPSGSLFLFDRKVLRYFRKDGHNWRKKKDGKTVREAHEKLKVGSIDVLHCYYAHGEENESFQRRSYWMLEPELMHIVFVHYLEVKGNKTNFGGVREIDEFSPDLQKVSPQISSPSTSHCKEPSGNTDYTSPSSSLTSLCEDADTGDSYQASSTNHSFSESPQPQIGNGLLMNSMDVSPLTHPNSNNYEGLSSIHGANYMSQFLKDRPIYNDVPGSGLGSQKSLGLGSWEEILEQSTRGCHNVPSHISLSSTEPVLAEVALEQQTVTLSNLSAGESSAEKQLESSLPIHSSWQISLEDNSMLLPKWSTDQPPNLELPCSLENTLFEQSISDANFAIAPELFNTHLDQQKQKPVQNNPLGQLSYAESESLITSNTDSDISTDGNINYSFSLRRQLLDGEEGLKKVDSFSRWVSKELGEVDNLQMQSSSGISWSTVECGSVVDDSTLSPSLSQDQLFSITDFSPKCGYTDVETEVLITGAFLKSQQEVARYKWSCMFGEVEVPAEILVDGVLCCNAPPHRSGTVPFYVTCSNRIASSEVREFDYLLESIKGLDITNIYGGDTDEMHLHLQLERSLSCRSVNPPNHIFKDVMQKRELINKIISLKEEEESKLKLELTSENDVPQYEVKERLLKILTKDMLYSWLLHKVAEDGKGPSVLDDYGQGVLHLASALGYNWAIIPIVTSGVSINFRDLNGWTALHWAAFYGREQTVAFLVSLGAAPGAVTDPSPENPLGRTPADLASVKGQKGISGFLAESSLTSYLSSLTVNDQKDDGIAENSGTKAVQTVSERTATPVNYFDMPDTLSLKDSLTAVRNATQAADRIHQMFRMQSFERRELSDYGDDEYGLSDEHALSLLAAKSSRLGPSYGQAHAAAVHIQKKFRGWKKRKEFLIIRQRIVKIQAHVRGHQVRKQYKAIIWSVGILEKVILRWRRKGSGLRGFRKDAVIKEPYPHSENMPLKDDDYDFIKEGRKQTEERLQKALTRVKSMVQYPEARAQYRRLLNVVEGFRETKGNDMASTVSEETTDADEDLINIDTLLDNDTFMSIAFE